MTRKDLEKIYWLKRELKMWEERLHELEADMSPDTPAPDGMPHSVTNAIKSPTEDKAIVIADHIAIISGKAAELRMTIKEVETFIAGIDDPLIRQIVDYRCVKCMQWEEVAEKLGKNYPSERARQIYHRFVVSLGI